jgi:hypothetical protein
MLENKNYTEENKNYLATEGKMTFIGKSLVT